MTPARRELLVARIVSGVLRFRQGGKTYLLTHPDAPSRCRAQEIYEREYEKALASGVMEDETPCLKWHGLWSEEDDELLEKVRADLDDFKIKLYENFSKQREADAIRDLLEKCREKQGELSSRRHAFSFLTAQSLANMAKLRYLAVCGLRRTNGKKVFKNFWKNPEAGELVDWAVDHMVNSRLGEAEFRELARNEPWNSIWASRVGCPSIFSVPATELTDDQRQMVLWANMYEQIQSAHEPPPREVIEDDDALDGWMLLRKKEAGVKHGVDALVSNEKIKNCDEVFIVADSAAKARKIEELNSQWARSTKANIGKTLAERGRVEEQNRPDVKLRLQMEANKGIK